jgi:uncharacterized protein (TIGR02246 family)
MNYRITIAALVIALAGLTACSGGNADPTPAIEATNKVFVENFLKGDEKALAGLYTEDAKVVAPGAPVATGRSEIARFWRGSMDTGIKDLTLRTLHASADGDLAYEDGAVTILRADGTPVGARYLVVWKRIDGQWYLHRDIWNVGAQ